jgi:IS5 family transposase
MGIARRNMCGFRRFAGLPLDQGVPGRATIWRFPAATRAPRPVQRPIFAEINRQLVGRGVIVRKWTLIDATIVGVAVKPPPGKDAEFSWRDPRARLDRKEWQEPVRLQGPHRRQPTQRALVRGDEEAVDADKAYGGQKFRDALPNVGITDGVMHKARRKPHSRTGSADSTTRYYRSASG